MLESLFGAEMPLPVRFFIAFVFVLGLIGVTAWGVRRFGAQRLGGSGRMDRRQPRLAVIDATAVDGRRRLILIRRDNVEHLLMIGGPTDVVIEPNIVRAAAASARETAPPARPATAAEPLPRAVALGDTGNWPLQPEPAPAARTPRTPAVEEPMSWPAEPEFPSAPPQPASRRQPRVVDPLAGLAAELGRNEPRVPMPGDAPAGIVPREPRMREPAREREVQIEREPMREREPPMRERELLREIREPVREPAREREAAREREPAKEREAARDREPVRLREPQPPPPPPPEPEEEFNAEADQNLADMAQRLEAALRRPAKAADGRSGEAAAPRAVAANAESSPPVPRAVTAATEASAAPKAGKSLYDSLEKEMASLLGRPGGKA
jgi:flagellar biogenesis protein FliO